MRENKQHKIEVHVAAICFNDKNEVLVLKRAQNRKLYPGLWECGGGQVEIGESFEKAIIRQMKEEAGIIINPIKPFGTYKIDIPDNPQKKIPGIKFVCKLLKYYNTRKPKLSKEHTKYKWLGIHQINGLTFIPNIKKDIKTAHQLLTGLSTNK